MFFIDKAEYTTNPCNKYVKILKKENLNNFHNALN